MDVDNVGATGGGGGGVGGGEGGVVGEAAEGATPPSPPLMPLPPPLEVAIAALPPGPVLRQQLVAEAAGDGAASPLVATTLWWAAPAYAALAAALGGADGLPVWLGVDALRLEVARRVTLLQWGPATGRGAAALRAGGGGGGRDGGGRCGGGDGSDGRDGSGWGDGASGTAAEPLWARAYVYRRRGEVLVAAYEVFSNRLAVPLGEGAAPEGWPQPPPHPPHAPHPPRSPPPPSPPRAGGGKGGAEREARVD